LVTHVAAQGRLPATTIDLAAARALALTNNTVRLALYRFLFSGSRA
jgi:hypothetical protein